MQSHAIDESGNVRDTDAADPSRVVVAGGAVNPQAGNSYDLTPDDNGAIIALSNVSAITLSVSAGAVPYGGFHATIIQAGSGTVTLSAGSGVTLAGGSATTGIGAIAELYSTGADVVYLGGAVT